MDPSIPNSDLPILDENFRKNQNTVNAPISPPMGISGSIPGLVSGSVAQNVHQANRKDKEKDNPLNSSGSISRLSMSRSSKKSSPRRKLKKIEAQISDMDVNSLLNLNSVKDVRDRRGEFSFGNSRSKASKSDEMPEDRSIDDLMV
ncbi:hypothetical protein L6452_32493 [Arctium lappa]|uniref:Uncharacterized protein n=1 Tax=Arctium lappa TaxID=4217 RepID=A0ACB8Z4G8_ARCLA|nr:hypothetical protein L6452_32493 [Arctium lappa]